MHDAFFLQISGWGRNVAMGYLNKETETREVMTEDNWLKLGDLGYLDEVGFLTVLGKEENFITLNTGEVISPLAVSHKHCLLNQVIMIYTRSSNGSAWNCPASLKPWWLAMVRNIWQFCSP